MHANGPSADAEPTATDVTDRLSVATVALGIYTSALSLLGRAPWGAMLIAGRRPARSLTPPAATPAAAGALDGLVPGTVFVPVAATCLAGAAFAAMAGRRDGASST